MTTKILRARLQDFLLRFDRLIRYAVYLASALVLTLSQSDGTWAALFGRWAPIVTVLVTMIAGEIRKAQAADPPK